MASALRSYAFALFQLIVTPPYALSVLLLAWLPPVPRYRYITQLVRAEPVGGTLDLRHPIAA